MADILKERGLPLPEPTSCPVTLWDVFGEQGHPVRAATMISRTTRVQMRCRFSSCRPLRCWMLAHLL